MKHTNVEGHADLIRDNSTGAILNNDTSQYNQYLSQRAKRKQGTERIDNMETDLKDLKNDINEIKSLLRALSNG